jgi:hypothetical protein
MNTNDIITTTLEIIRDFKENREEEPGVWELAGHYERQIRDTEIEGVEDELLVYEAADEILSIIGREYHNNSFGSLRTAVIDHLRGQVGEAIRAL